MEISDLNAFLASFPPWLSTLLIALSLWLLWVACRFLFSDRSIVPREFDIRITMEGDPTEKGKQISRVAVLAKSHGIELVEIEGGNIELRNPTQSIIDEIGKLPITPEKLTYDIKLIEK